MGFLKNAVCNIKIAFPLQLSSQIRNKINEEADVEQDTNDYANMLYLPLIVGFSLVAFGYSQDLELQTSPTVFTKGMARV